MKNQIKNQHAALILIEKETISNVGHLAEHLPLCIKRKNQIGFSLVCFNWEGEKRCNRE